jgi:FAD/FMN-containing dehydrogenase
VGLALPFAGEQEALAFVVAARGSGRLRPRCLEFFDAHAAAIFAGDDVSSERPPLVYLEEALAPGQEPGFDGWLELAEAHQVRDADIQVYDDDAALRRARRRRHAVPATMDELGSRCRVNGGRRITTDWAVPCARLGEVLRMARGIADERGVEQAVIFGHAGNGHPHQNFVCHDPDELRRVEDVVEETLRRVVAAGGTVAAEHGIGKLKRRWLPLQMSALQLAAMRALKHELDPGGRLAPGNVL